MSNVEEKKRELGPEWFMEIDLCHLIADDRSAMLCGEQIPGDATAVGAPCPPFDGLALCSGCGLPKCPRCVQLDGLLRALDA